MMILPLIPVMLLIVRTARTNPPMTFKETDPVTGMQVECDRCPPGTYLRTRCTSSQSSQCAPCPPGSFTELWNHISKCLRCGVCGHNQVVKSACTAHSDCLCECKPGYFYKRSYDMCLRHSECPSGQGVLTKGTPDEDTVCQVCSNGTFSSTVSAHQNCTEHKSCDAAGLHLVLRGSSWHDSLCASCQEPTSRDGANYLREILPAFFIHHKMSLKRLRRIVHRLLSEDHHRGTSLLGLSELNARINDWVTSATAKQIRQLPGVLNKTGANGASERLQMKLQRIDSNLNNLCALENEVDVVLRFK